MVMSGNFVDSEVKLIEYLLVVKSFARIALEDSSIAGIIVSRLCEVQ